MAETKLSAATLAKVVKLVGVQKELTEKLLAVNQEIDELLGGGAGVAELMKQFERTFDELWCARYANGERGRYVWRFAVDRPNLKRLLRTLGLEELTARATRYMRNADPFIVRSRHPFGLFVSGINTYAAEAPGGELTLEAPAVHDCRHSPACKSDQEHTRRKLAEMRAS
jgi:hypothetical protein